MHIDINKLLNTHDPIEWIKLYNKIVYVYSDYDNAQGFISYINKNLMYKYPMIYHLLCEIIIKKDLFINTINYEDDISYITNLNIQNVYDNDEFLYKTRNKKPIYGDCDINDIIYFFDINMIIQLIKSKTNDIVNININIQSAVIYDGIYIIDDKDKVRVILLSDENIINNIRIHLYGSNHSVITFSKNKDIIFTMHFDNIINGVRYTKLRYINELTK